MLLAHHPAKEEYHAYSRIPKEERDIISMYAGLRLLVELFSKLYIISYTVYANP
jgi:hypothetical protein